MDIEYFDYCTEYGLLRIGVYDSKLCFCYFLGGRDVSKEIASMLELSLVEAETELSRLAFHQAIEFINGERKYFDLPYKLYGTQFRVDVWKKLIGLPYGSVITYGELAARLGRPTAARAVASAVGHNPLFAIVPCHRVVAVSGIGGYAWGQSLKIHLLDNESQL